MIQRIQSLFLLLAAGATAGLFGMPFATSGETLAGSVLFADQSFDIRDNPALLITFGLSGLLCLVAIFLFKNRLLQMRLSLLAALALVAGAGLAGFFFFRDSVAGSVKMGLGLTLPVIALLFILLAYRNIKKDEKLVRSMDRLR